MSFCGVTVTANKLANLPICRLSSFPDRDIKIYYCITFMSDLEITKTGAEARERHDGRAEEGAEGAEGLKRAPLADRTTGRRSPAARQINRRFYAPRRLRRSTRRLTPFKKRTVQLLEQGGDSTQRRWLPVGRS